MPGLLKRSCHISGELQVEGAGRDTWSWDAPHWGASCVLAIGPAEAFPPNGAVPPTEGHQHWYYLACQAHCLPAALIASQLLYHCISCPEKPRHPEQLSFPIYAPLVAAIVCYHCYSTLFFPTKGTELNEMLHYQCVFLYFFFFFF